MEWFGIYKQVSCLLYFMCICEHPQSLHIGYNFQRWFLPCVEWELILHGSCLFPAASLSTAGCCFTHPYFYITHYFFSSPLACTKKENIYPQQIKSCERMLLKVCFFFCGYRKPTPYFFRPNCCEGMGVRL